jgi:hypothetical protein
MTKEELKKIMFIIENESKGFMPIDEQNRQLKFNTWFTMLQSFDYEKVEKATLHMLARFTYGTSPKIGDLFEVLVPKKDKEAEAQNIADTFYRLCLRSKDDYYEEGILYTKGARTLITERLGDDYGYLYDKVNSEIRNSTVEQTVIIKSQLRKSIKNIIESPKKQGDEFKINAENVLRLNNLIGGEKK